MLMQKLKPILKSLFSDVRQAIVGVIVIALLGSIGGLLYLSKTALYFSIAILNTPTPLWATIALVLLVGVYIYLKISRNQSCLKANLYTIIRGLKIKNLPNGGYEEKIAYCFHCESPMSFSSRMKVLECTKCGYKSSIQARHLQCVIAELKGEELPEWWKNLY